MRNFIIAVLLCLVCSVGAQTPTKLFDVRNGNGAVDGANTYSHATLVVFRDAQAKSDMIDAFCDAYGYQAESGTKQAFFNNRLKEFMRGVYKNQKLAVARRTAEDSTAATVDADLP